MSALRKPNLHPLRTAGQSTDEKIQTDVDKFWPSLFLTIFLVALAIVEWLRHLFKTPPAPWLYSFLAVLAVVACVFDVRRTRSRLQRLRQGRDGERVVAEYLDALRAHGFRVLHDVVGGSFNIDHVLVGPSGVFVVETKTWTKRPGQDICFDGERLLIGGREDCRPLRQAKGQAKWLSELVGERIGRRIFVKAIVSFADRYVKESTSAGSIFVLNPKRLHTIANQPRTLTDAEIGKITTHIENFVRYGTPV